MLYFVLSLKYRFAIIAKPEEPIVDAASTLDPIWLLSSVKKSTTSTAA